MRYLATAILLLSLNLPAYAREGFDFGTENYRWSEYGSNGSRYLTESGLREFIGYRRVDQYAAGATTLQGRVYFGDVFYDGQLQDGTPYTATTGYTGFSLEQSRVFEGDSAVPHGELGFGLDYWQRVLDKGGSAGYTEDYLALYVRAGLAAGNTHFGWYGNAGLKYPLTVNETVQAYPLDTLQLYPTPALSLYAELGQGYGDWRWALYYDSYRFEQSPVVLATIGGVPYDYYVQPKSVMDRIGVRFSMTY